MSLTPATEAFHDAEFSTNETAHVAFYVLNVDDVFDACVESYNEHMSDEDIGKMLFNAAYDHASDILWDFHAADGVYDVGDINDAGAIEDIAWNMNLYSSAEVGAFWRPYLAATVNSWVEQLNAIQPQSVAI